MKAALIFDYFFKAIKWVCAAVAVYGIYLYYPYAKTFGPAMAKIPGATGFVLLMAFGFLFILYSWIELTPRRKKE